ncbi:hypothetical protein GCM10027290_46510 [Micromonospora sonneratiae]|uniref:DUF6232 family protein n=1 Tax=Micromonospora sonneratiae TaxID=1184706 RepID=A0ABW3YAH1_9ACTN
MVAIYYRDDSVQVTSESVRAGGHTIPITELTYVWHVSRRGSVREGGRLVGRSVLIFLLSIPPLVAIVCVVSLAYAAHDRGEWLLAGTILAVCLLGALALAPFLEVPLGWLDRSYDKGARINELWVQRNGQEILLLSTSNALRFGQIYRAVQRVVERHGG